ncbi:MAG TPA: hypothetical protein VGR91_18905 [Stellaceae bacterium]|nr:hypothetical protein [Stellaceae bacterium]
MAGHNSLAALEAELRATRARLAALLARADRDYALRPILNALKRGAGREVAVPAAEPERRPEQGGHLPRLALPAAMLGFALALATLHRRRPDGADQGAGDDG